MDNLTDRLTEMLSDPNQVERIKEMASSMFQGEQSKSSLPIDDSDLSPETATTIMKAVSALKSVRRDDKQTNFLLALKPLLAPERRERVDTALKFMRVFSALPMLIESGILNLIQ